MKNIFFLILGLLIILGSIFSFSMRTSVRDNKIKNIRINDTNINVEIVDTPKTREKGLSGKISLKENTGMFFIFDAPDKYGFWMKNMNFPIDIVWIDEQYRIVNIEKNISPETFPQVFYPDQVVKYVLEIPAGSVDSYLIATGTVVQF